ncbi:hypothetical protein ACFL27_28280 [candidate division CSSED10-310 bacterium]|uniref:Glyoxalase n=1 Tax=candidate division CSSED10-310 bacterium TaxID=2855610 RepID=A0ABV6Z6N4_UNCC1
MEPIIDHIQITVKDMNIATPFYDRFLPLLGFEIQNKVSAVIAEHDFHVVEYTYPRLAIAITSLREVFKGTDYTFKCSEIVGRKFENISDHAGYLRDGGCSEIIKVLATTLSAE